MSDLRLPPELAHEIIEYLWDDRSALKSCALTCHSFVASSQRQLFSSVVLELQSADGMTSSAGATGANFKCVLERSPHIAGYVRGLEINNLESISDCTAESRTYQTLILCLAPLRNLRALKLRCHHGRLDPEGWRTFVHGTALHTLLETLQLHKIIHLDFDRFPLAMASRCSAVRHLALRLPETQSLDPTAGTCRYSEMHPQSLRLDAFEPQGNLRKLDRPVVWLTELTRANISPRGLKKLHIGTDVTEWQESCGGWTTLMDCAATLEDLSFELHALHIPTSLASKFLLVVF